MAGVLKGPHALKILQATKAEAFQSFIDEKISFVDFDEWCEDNCDRWHIDADRLKRWIIDAQQTKLTEANCDRSNSAAKVANLMGATVKRTLAVYLDALSAVKVKRLVDRNGKPVKDDDGKPMQLEQPDWEPRLKAAEQIGKILGVYAPEKQELILPQLDEFTKRTEDELRRELATLRASQGNKNPARIEGEASGEGLPLLAPERDNNEGRTGGSPLQAVPVAAVLSTDSRRPQ